MKADCPSSTSLLIARATLLAEATPELRPLLLPGTVELTRRLVETARRAWWFELALRRRFVRRLLFGLERFLLPGILVHWLARKRWIDGLAREALAGGCRQVVVLGAGLDTLALRLESEAVCFEIDHPATQATKRRAFAEGPVLIPADLGHVSVSEVLRAEERFDQRQPTLYVAEGLLMYLPPERVPELFRGLAGLSAPGSRFIFTFMEAQPGRPIEFHHVNRLVSWWLRWRGEPFRWALAPEDAARFAAGNGWTLDSLSTPEEVRRRCLAPIGLDSAPLARGESVAMAHLSAK